MPNPLSLDVFSIAAGKRWSRLRDRVTGPRRHLRVLPSLTRPNLYAGD